LKKPWPALLLLLLPSAAPFAAAEQGHVLWVTLGESDELVEVDPQTLTILRRIKTDPRPHGLAASADGSKVYVGSDKTGNFQVIDARLGKVVAQVHVGDDPNQMTLTKDGGTAFVPLRGEHQIAVVQLEPLALLRRSRRRGARTTRTRPRTAGASTSGRWRATRSACSTRSDGSCFTTSGPGTASGRWRSAGTAPRSTRRSPT
jgi:YVTN family beta-propeller protein